VVRRRVRSEARGKKRGHGPLVFSTPRKKKWNGLTVGISYLPDGLLVWIAPKWWAAIKKAGDDHDAAYERGGTERDKENADLIFKHALEEANHSKLARFFTACVIFRGHKSFNYTKENSG